MTNDIRILVDSRLNSIKTSYGIKDIGYRLASDQKVYPHVVWDITTTTPADMGREDYLIDFHVWGKEEIGVFQIMDAIKDLFMFRNVPTNTILPTFYEMSAGTIEDPDRTLAHGVVRMQCQVYETGATDSGILNKEGELNNGNDD